MTICGYLKIVLVACASSWSLSGAVGGIKRRMEAAEAAEEAEANCEELGDNPASSSSSGVNSGGIKQRAQRLQDLEEGDLHRQGPLFKRYKKKWAEGKMSAVELQKSAFDAVGQGARGMDAMAALGKTGKHPQHTFGALKRLLGLPAGVPTFTWADIPTVHGERTPHPFLLPHELFAEMFKARRDHWMSAVSGQAGAALEFWQSVRRSDFVRLHPSLPKTKWHRTVPIGIHGDGAAFSHQDSVYTLSWNSLLGEGGTIHKRFVATVVKKSDMVEHTLSAICKILSWSFNALLAGESPHLDWDGHPIGGGGQTLADGWAGALCQARGDWAWYCELFKFPQWNSADRMCWLCRASSTNPALGWSKFGPSAGWRETRWSHEGYLNFLRAAGMFIPPLLVLATGFRLECVMIDVLHTVDQGVAAHIIANVLWTFAVLRKVFGGSTQEQRVKNLYTHLQKWYSKSRPDSRLKGKLTIERLRTQGEWPKLKAKAAATRYLAAYALSIAQEFGTSNHEDRQILALCQLLQQFYDTLSSESQFLSATAKKDLPLLGQRLTGLYVALATSAKERNQKLWKLMPKLHLFQHLCEWQALTQGNPRFYTTYADEDLAGKMATTAESCHPRTMNVNALFKWAHMAFD